MIVPEDFIDKYESREIHSFPLKSMDGEKMNIVGLSVHDRRAWLNGIEIHRGFIREAISKVDKDSVYEGWECYFEAGEDVLLRKSMAYPDGRLMWENNDDGFAKFLKTVSSRSGVVDEIMREIISFNGFSNSEEDQKKN